MLKEQCIIYLMKNAVSVEMPSTHILRKKNSELSYVFVDVRK